jgi:hypothetical protein
MTKFLPASLLALGLMCTMSAVAQDTYNVSGTLRTTANANQWHTKYLGGQHTFYFDNYYQTWFGTPNPNFNWASQRSYYADGTLNYSGYSRPFVVPSNVQSDARFWGRIPHLNLDSWISPSSNGIGPNGFHSYVTTIDDSSLFSHLESGDIVTFDRLEINFLCDENMQAIFINGVRYTGLSAAPPNHIGWGLSSAVSLNISNINWNIDGANTIEFVVYNTGLNIIGTYTAYDNPTGLSASVRAFYTVTEIPEPETYAMMLAGLGLIGVVARRRKSL